MTDLLELALNDLVPSFDDARPDWADVVARSQTHVGLPTLKSSWHRHPRRLVALAFAVLLVVLLATPAFGVQGYVLHLLGRHDVSFGSSPSAQNVVKKQFLDMPVGAPPQWNTPVRAAQARVVGAFTIAGHPRNLYVAPTTKGGYCYAFERSFGGCRQTRSDRSIGGRGQFGVTWQGGSSRPRVNESIVTRIAGDITAPSAATITARYADGTTTDIAFIWVSAPVAAGFFSYDIPTRRWNKQRRLLSLTLYAKDRRKLAQQSFRYEAHSRPLTVPGPSMHIGTPRERVLPTTPPVAPTAPTQGGSADGFKVVIGHNGAVQFTQVGQTPILRELRGRSVSFGCARLTKEFGIFTVRGLGQEARLASKVGFMLSGVGSPVDVCEVQASIGRTWPDRLHNRAAVEIALTPAGGRYLADRQAARDLALFVRSRRMHQLREEPALRAKRDIAATYGRQLAHSQIRVAVIDSATIRFSERSGTGKTFTVTVRRGHITNQNLRPYAFVF